MAFVNYTKEFKDKAVEMYIDCQSGREVAKELGISAGTILSWVKAAGFASKKEESAPAETSTKQENPQINPLLLNMAQGNDLTAFVGKDITKMQPREIFKFLELLNIKGTLIVEQKVKLK